MAENMYDKAVKKVVVVGGGTAGWISAAVIKRLIGTDLTVTLVESEDIGTVGVGEATIPPIITLNNVLGIDEKEFLRETNATMKLAIKFENWRVKGEDYFHTFGAPGKSYAFCHFHHYFKRAQKLGLTDSIWEYDLNYLACKAGKFAHIKSPDPIIEMPYAYHFDASLYARFLRKKCEAMGVTRKEGIIHDVTQDSESGFITGVTLKDGEHIEGDLFIDCSGFKGLLTQQTLNTGYEDWSHWLPCDRAVAMPSERLEKTLPYTRSIAHSAGWQWRIPLQHRNGNGLVYSSNYYTDEQALDILSNNLDTKPLADPNFIRFKTGRRRKQWNKNVIAVGLSSGFLEPLESTSIHLIQSAVVRLIHLFPHEGFKQRQIDEYNKQSKTEYEQIRDFIILHYHVNERTDSHFWKDLREMDVPDSLTHKIELFRESGNLFREQNDLFLESSWLQVLMGQGIAQGDYHPLANALSEQKLQELMQNIKRIKNEPIGKIATHDDFLKQFCGQPFDMNRPMNIVIAGGGTAGWMAANYFAHKWPSDKVKVTLVESPDIGIIGVGEGSTPTLKRFFEELKIKESDWMPKCNATYKVSIQFNDWSPSSGVKHYRHPFISQTDTFTQRAFEVNCRTRRLGLDTHVTPEDFLLNGVLAKQNKAPITPDNFPFRMEYGYHFDSALLGNYLRDVAVEKGVTHISAVISDVVLHLSGDISHLVTEKGNIEGDFFVDCTGFSSHLLQQTLGVKFNSYSDNLFNDSAVVLPTHAYETIPVETQSTALSNGWCWSIPLQNRTGNGYVYSASHLTKDKAEEELRRHLGLENSNVEARHLKMKVGQVAQHWQKNCLALGLSQGFMEPLEATALHLVQICIEYFSDTFEKSGFSSKGSAAYNAFAKARFDRVRDYIVAHYKLNTRDDSEYWRANRNNMVLSDSLKSLISTWFQREDLTSEINRQNIGMHWDSVSWHCLFAGYGAFPPLEQNQPGRGDLYSEQKIERFIQGCALNFNHHNNVLQTQQS